MISYKVEIEENGIFVDYTAFTKLSIPANLRLDTGLDTSEITLACIDKEETFKPFTRVKITAGSKVFRFYTGDPKKPISVGGDIPKYTHTLNLIEITKITERRFLETATVTQQIKGIYNSDFINAQKTTGGWYDWFYNEGIINSIIYDISQPLFIGDTLTLPSRNDIFSYDSPPATITDCTINSTIGVLTENQTLNFTIAQPFFIEYIITFNVAGDLLPVTLRYDFLVDNIIGISENKTISTELTRLVNIVKLRRFGIDFNEFVIDSEILTKYNDVKCPEFNFTRCTFWEALSQIGDFIHAIPRVISDASENWNVVTYDFLGLNENAVNGGIKSYIEGSYLINDYATELDSQISNIMNIDNEDEGSLVEPSENLFRTVRVADNEIAVTDDNGFFYTSKPIAKLKKVEVLYNGNVYDITKYCYESYEYGILSDYSANYPYSKAYALEYTLGSPNIIQLQHKNVDLISPAFQNWAIYNILKKEGATMGGTTGLIVGLGYRIEYVPIIEARAKQSKSFTESGMESTIVYNQQSNVVNSSAYGENMKGAILRYGNEETLETFYAKNIEDVPNLGTIVGDKYISVISLELNSNYIKYTIEYSKDFNRLSGYTGINSNIRMYEISERQAFDRMLNYSGNVEIGFENTWVDSDRYSIVKRPALQSIAQTFTQDPLFTNVIYDPSLAILQTMDNNGNVIKKIGLPLNTFGFGNSLLFTCKFRDNYSADNKVLRGQVTNKLLMEYVPYTDYWGGVKYLSFAFTKPTINTNLIDKGDTLPEIPTEEYLDLYDPVISSKALEPSITNENFPHKNGALFVDKDNREILGLTIQVNFITYDRDFIIGFGLTNANNLVRLNNTTPVKVYALPQKINKFDKVVDLTGATLIKEFTSMDDFDFSTSENFPFMSINAFTTSVACESVAFVNSDGNLVLGINKQYNANETINAIYFNCKI